MTDVLLFANIAFVWFAFFVGAEATDAFIVSVILGFAARGVTSVIKEIGK